MSEFNNRKDVQRLEWLDLVRIFACFSVLFFHVINGYMKDAMTFSEMIWPDYMSFIWKVLSLYHVPTFFSISGYLYQKFNAGNFSKWNHGKIILGYKNFILKKVISLGIPYLLFSITYIFLSSFLANDMHTYYSIESILYLFKEPVAQYWYLHTLLLIFLIAPIISFVLKGNVAIQILILGFLNIFGIFFNFPTDTIGKVLFYYVYFTIGSLLAESNIIVMLGKKINTMIIILLFILTCAIYCVMDRRLINNEIKSVFVCVISVLLIMEIFCCAYSLKQCYKIPQSIVGVAKYTLHIYLIHTWITGTLRVILRHLNIYSLLVHTIVGVVVGSVVSLLAAIIIKKIKILNV
ncbi:MAG: acyltransferase family protein, partial [Lachnospiraceae bacterium]